MTTGNEVGACDDAVTHHKQQVNARLSAQARAVLAAIHERTGTNRTAIIEQALAHYERALSGPDTDLLDACRKAIETLDDDAPGLGYSKSELIRILYAAVSKFEEV